MPIVVQVCSLLAAACLGGTLLLLAIIGVCSVIVHMAMPSSIGALDALVALGETGAAWPLALGGLLALPGLVWVHVGTATATRAFRSPLSVYPGAAVVVVAALTTITITIIRQGTRGLEMVLSGALDIGGGYAMVVPSMVVLIGALLTGGRVAGVGAILSAPLVVLTLQSVLLEQSITHTAGGATIPFLLLALALGSALITRGGLSWRLVWPLGALATLPFAIFLATGLFTPRELLSFALIGALVIGLAIHGGARGERARRFAITVAMENGALALAIAGHALVMVALALLGVLGQGQIADFAGNDASLALAILALAHVALSALLTPVVALIPVLPVAGVLIAAKLPPLMIMVVLATAAMLGLVARMTTWRMTGVPAAADDVTLPRTAGIIALVTGIAIMALMIWAPQLLLALA